MKKPKKKANAFKAKKPRKPSVPKKKPKKKKRVLDSDDEEEDSEDSDFETESRKKRHIKATQGQGSRQTRGVALKYSLADYEKEYSDDDD